MTAPLQLFPARIRFVNADGTLTPEASRALQNLSVQIGGEIGDVGIDTFSAFASPGQSDSSQFSDITAIGQADSGGFIAPLDQQTASQDFVSEMTMQPGGV